MKNQRKFDTNYPVHVISRAVEGRKIFSAKDDCLRFIFQAYAMNVGRPVRNLWRRDVVKCAQALLSGEEISSRFIIKEHNPLVYFLDFALVVNHNHLYLVQNADGGISLLMKRLNNGFAQYFNLKHVRKGTLFDGRYRAVIAKDQFQSDAISRYISTINPLDVFQPKWREKGLKNVKGAFNFLENYQFSSFPDKIGQRKSKFLAPPEILEKYLTIGPREKREYKDFVKSFLSERSNSAETSYLE